MFTVGVYADKSSNVRGLFTGRKVRGFPPGYGDCVLGQTETVPAEVKKVVFDICKQLGFSGIAEFEFKRDAITGEFFLIEINPRSWSWIGITPAAGVSLPWLAFQDLSKKEIPTLLESKFQNGAVKYVKLLQDFDNCLWRNKLAGYPAWDFSIWDWVRSLRAECLVIAEYSPDDLKPSLYAGCVYLLTKAKRLFEWCQKKWSRPKVGKRV
jgi:hypothetical protein